MAQGGVFRPEKVVNMRLFGRFNPFGAERSLSTHDALHNIFNHLFQSLWNRARSFDEMYNIYAGSDLTFQSLWSRAGSFDPNKKLMLEDLKVSIPLEQGGVFRLTGDLSFKQGD